MNTINISLKQNMVKKDKSISMCKAIAILLMVMAHSGVDYWVAAFISMFHMPIFFFLSGFCFKPSYLTEPKLFMVKRLKGLYVPYVKWMLLFIILHNALCKFHILDPQSVGFYSWNQIIEKIARTVFTFVGGEQLLGGFWFLRELFWGALIAYLLLKYLKNKYAVLALSLSVALLCHLTSYHLPTFGIGYTSFMASSYFVSGHIFRSLSVHPLRPIMIVLSYGLVFIGSIFWNFDAVQHSTLLVIPYFLTAIIGVWATYSLCMLLNSASISSLIYIGNNTMPILTWHFLSFKLVSLLIIAFYNLPLSRLSDFPYINNSPCLWGWLLYFVVGSTLPLLFDYVIIKVYMVIKAIKIPAFLD